MEEYGKNFMEENPGFIGNSVYDASTTYNSIERFENWIKSLLGIKPEVVLEPSIPKISEKIESLSTKDLYIFYRYFNNVPDDGSDLYNAIKSALGYNKPLERVTEYINGFERTQQLHDLINNISEKVGMGLMPLSVGLETLGIIEKRQTTNTFTNNEEVKHTK